jgi:predicted RNase H-like nuclease (RuvC/YqgF family)
MSDKSSLLAETLVKQDEILSELLSVTQSQREALKEGRLSRLQELMSEMRHTSVRAQAIETKRSRLAAEIAAGLGCEAVVSKIAGVLPHEESEPLKDAAGKLMSTVGRLKTEMSILSRLMEEAKNLNEMLINEWRKMSSGMVGPGGGGFDARI